MGQEDGWVRFEQTKDRRIKKLNGWLYARFSCKGIPVDQALRTKTFSAAVELTNRIHNSILLGDPSFGLAKPLLFEDQWPFFLEAKGKGSRRTKKSRESTLKEYIRMGERYFLPLLGDKRIDRFDDEMIEQYFAAAQALSDKGKITPKPISLFNHWKYLHSFFGYCLKQQLIQRMPPLYNPDRNDDEDETPGKNYSDDELCLLRLHSQHNFQMHLWILMAQYMGMRSREITGILKDRVDLERNLIKLKKSDTKTKQGRKIPIHSMVKPFLTVQLNAAKSPYLFPNRIDPKRPMDATGFKKPWTKLREDLNIEGRFHDFRHSYATRAFGNPNLNPLLVCTALGMSILTAQKIYIHFTDRDLSKVAEEFSL